MIFVTFLSVLNRVPAPDVPPLLVDLEEAEVLQSQEADDHQEEHLHQQTLDAHHDLGRIKGRFITLPITDVFLLFLVLISRHDEGQPWCNLNQLFLGSYYLKDRLSNISAVDVT